MHVLMKQVNLGVDINIYQFSLNEKPVDFQNSVKLKLFEFCQTAVDLIDYVL